MGKPLDKVPDVEYKKISEMPYENIPKLVLWTDLLEESEVENFVRNNIHGKFSTLEVVKSYTPFDKSWQITSLKGTKQAAIKKLAELLYIQPSNIVGIGDSYNDYPLLSACGYKVAMGTAPSELKQIADFIAPSYSEDGVAVVIDKLLSEEKGSNFLYPSELNRTH